MRLRLAGMMIIFSALGCMHSSPKAAQQSAGPVVKEYSLPPDEARYNNSPDPMTRGGPQFVVGGRSSHDAPIIVHPGGQMQFIP